MRFVALVSGGKDSCFNILHCVKNGHELVAIANLYPQGASDEIDSFMYQTVGFQAVGHYGECLGVPLYRAPIRGSSVLQTLEYSETKNDESEDLYDLLVQVKQAHPDVEAVSVGAILSSYQRTRVENVCSRLGLVPLAYLWQRSQAELLDEIIDSGVDARLIKVAAVGLDERHLGKSLAEVRADLVKLNSMYGLHLCGEGGEYETLVFDAPIFKKRLEPVKTTVVKHTNDDVWYLTLEVKAVDKVPPIDFQVRIPPLLGERALEVADGLDTAITVPTLQYEKPNQKTATHQPPLHNPSPSSTAKQLLLGSGGGPPRKENTANTNRIVSITTDTIGTAPETIQQEVEALLDEVQQRCEARNKTTNDIAFMSLLLRDMSDFAAANAVYGKYFTRPNPPSRICIQADIPHRAQVSAVLADGDRTGLHVQGRSYWAPANIGPYSQAVVQDGIIYQAGQIGLVPASLSLATGGPQQQGSLSLQHLWRVLHAVGGSQWASVVCFVSSPEYLELGQNIWESWHDSSAEDDFAESYSGPTFGNSVAASLLVAVVPGLPRNAAVEWSATGIQDAYLEAGHAAAIDIDDDDDDDESTFTYPPARTVTSTGMDVQFGNYTATIHGTNSLTHVHDELTSKPSVVSATLLAKGPVPTELASLCEVIPVRDLTYRGKPVLYGLTVVSRKH